MIHPIDITRNLFDLYQRTRASLAYSENYNTKLYNFPAHLCEQDLWLSRFIQHSDALKKKPKARIGLYSVFGPKWMIGRTRADVRIFLARENLHRINWKQYADQCIGNKNVDLIIGFDYNEQQSGAMARYIRVPLWIMWVFSPYDTFTSIKEKIARFEASTNKSYDDRKFCSFVSSHFDLGRDTIVEEVSSVGRIDCDGKLFHNNDDLKTLYNDDKLEYLRHYRFNLCPENSNYRGYCTEKIFEAITSGCVPIYNGSDNTPEPDVLNRDAIVFINIGGDNSEALQLVRDLDNDKKRYMDFACQKRFTPDAPDVIWGYYELLQKRIGELIANV